MRHGASAARHTGSAAILRAKQQLCFCAQMYTLSQAVFGVGVGGEYPIASTSASERAEADEALHDKRGETVMLTFSMQGEFLEEDHWSSHAHLQHVG